MYPAQQLDTEPGISAVIFASAGPAELDAAVLDLAAVLDGLVCDRFEIVVVEMAPAPGTSAKVTELTERFPLLALRSVEDRFPDESTALAAALATTAYDLIFVTSADGQYEMRELNHLLEAIEYGADLATGYRLNTADTPGWRLGRWTWNLLVRVLFGPTARDVECAFKLFRHAVWRSVRMRSPQRTAAFFVELLISARRLGFRVIEIPVTSHRSLRSDRPLTTGRAVADLVRLRAGIQPSANDLPWAGATRRRAPEAAPQR